MNEIMINFDTQTMSARELHERLEIGTEFAKWFSRMCDYGFDHIKDYTEVIVKNGENSKGGRPATDYEISIDMAKHICMLQRTEQGKAVRQYLIDLEKAWNTPEQVYARALQMANKTIEDMKNQRLADLPKIEYFDALVERNLLTNFTDTAKQLKVQRKVLLAMCYKNKLIFKDKKGNIRPYTAYDEHGKGYFSLKDSKNDKWTGVQTLVTPKGKEALRLMLEVNAQEREALAEVNNF